MLGRLDCRILRSRHQKCSMKKGALTNFTKFAGKHLCQGLFFNEVAGLRHKCFPVNFVKFLRTPFLQNTSASEFFKNYSMILVYAANI